MNKIAVLLLVFVGLFSCKSKSNYDGFSIASSGLNYKIHTLGDTDDKLHDSDFVSINYLVLDFKNKTVISQVRDTSFFYNEKDSSSIIKLLSLISIGDSASFIEEKKELIVSCKLLKKQPYKVGELCLKYPEAMIQISDVEKVEIAQILSNYSSDSIQYLEGMFLIHQIVGTGAFPVKGNEVVFDMESIDVKGNRIESTKQVGFPFSYVLGTKDQVIKGVDYGIRKMKKGGKSIFIVPSQLAYGANGSSTGIVPPYTTLIYDVELLSVN